MADEKLEIARSLGRIEATLTGIATHIENQDERIDRMDTRLRKVENKSAVTGAVTGTVAGGAISIVVAVIVEKFKLMG